MALGFLGHDARRHGIHESGRSFLGDVDGMRTDAVTIRHQMGSPAARALGFSSFTRFR